MAPRQPDDPPPEQPVIRVRRIHRRDLNRVWEFLKKVFRSVNRETVEYQRPRTKTRFLEIYEEEGIEQLLFEVHEGVARHVVGYAECAYEVIGSDSWINERYFDNRDMRPLFVEEIAIHPGYQGRGIGSFVIEQLEHLARVHGCTHLVLEVAANNKRALQFYRARSFAQLDAAIFLAKKVISEPELLPPRALRPTAGDDDLVLEPAEPAPADMPEEPSDAEPEPEPPRARRRAKPALKALAKELPVELPVRRRAKHDLEDMSEAPAPRRRKPRAEAPAKAPEEAPKPSRARKPAAAPKARRTRADPDAAKAKVAARSAPATGKPAKKRARSSG